MYAWSRSTTSERCSRGCRGSEVLVRDRVKFRVGQIVYVAFSQDETEIGFTFPKEERAALVAARRVAERRAAAGRPRGARPASRGPRAGPARVAITH